MSAQCLIASQLLLRKHIRISALNLIYFGSLLFHMGKVGYKQPVWGCVRETASVVLHEGEQLGIGAFSCSSEFKADTLHLILRGATVEMSESRGKQVTPIDCI